MASVVLPAPGSPVMATAVGRLRAAASSGSKCTIARARPRVSPIYGPTQPLPLHVRIQPDPLTGQRLAQQRELVPGGVDHIDSDITVMLDDRFHPADAQVSRRRRDDQPVPAVDERQPL